MALAAGDEGSHGVASVELASSSLERAVQSGNVVKQARVLRGYASDIIRYCDPAANPTSYRQCQGSAEKAIRPLLIIARDTLEEKEVRKDSLTDVRVTAWEALSRVCFGNSEATASVASTDVLEATAKFALRPIHLVQQQLEQLAALQLIQAVAALATEAPVLSILLPSIAALATQGCDDVEVSADGASEHHGFRAVRITALEVLLSCSHCHSRRTRVASLLPASSVSVLLRDVEVDDDSRGFAMSLLFANLCEFRLLGGLASYSEQEQTFGDIAQPLWNRTDFFNGLCECYAAALRAQPFPYQSGIYHRPWKLASTCMMLAMAGYREQLRGAAIPLAECVERRGYDREGYVDADVARAARIATVALLSLAVDAEVFVTLQANDMLLDVLRTMQAEEPAARDLREALESGVPPHCRTTVLSDVEISNQAASPFIRVA